MTKDYKQFFEDIYTRYNRKEYIGTDPIKFPHELSGNREFIAFTASIFAYGNVKAINKFLSNYFNHSGTDPIKLNTFTSDSLYYRFQRAGDVSQYSLIMNRIYDKYGSLRSIFLKHANKQLDECLKYSILDIRSEFKDITDGINFLLPIPGKSASKRLMMFMRWMVRKDQIDFGLWQDNFFTPSRLFLPIDTHIMRAVKNLNIIDSKASPRLSMILATEYFRSLNPKDPAKYDFALSRLGIAKGCKYAVSEVCNECLENSHCIFIDN